MKQIVWDTCVLLDRFVYRNPAVHEEFARLVLGDSAEDRLTIPKYVQAELYGLLRAGRVKVRLMPGTSPVPYVFAHEEIWERLSPYPLLFDLPFVESLNDFEWPLYDASYKEQCLYPILQQEYGWNDWGQERLEDYIGRRIPDLQQQAKERRHRKPLNDLYDYPVMAAAIDLGAHAIVTYNLKDFLDPLGNIRVMNFKAFVALLSLFEHNNAPSGRPRGFCFYAACD